MGIFAKILDEQRRNRVVKGDNVDFDRSPHGIRVSARLPDPVSQAEGGPAVDPILIVAHNPDTSVIDVTQSGWVTVGGTENSYQMKLGQLENVSLTVPDTFEGTFFICVHVLSKKTNHPEFDPYTPIPPDPPDPPIPPPAINDLWFELVQNADSGGTHHILRTSNQLLVEGDNNADINEWRLAGYQESMVPIALVKVVAPVAPATAPTITTSMMARNELLAHLARLTQPKSYKWVGNLASETVDVGISSGGFSAVDNSARHLNPGADWGVGPPMTSARQPFDGYAVFRWSADGSVSSTNFYYVTKAEWASGYGVGKAFNGHVILQLVIDKGRVLDIAAPTGGALLPSTRDPIEATFDVDDLVTKFNALVLVVNAIAVVVNAQHGTTLEESSVGVSGVPTIAFKNGIMQTIV